MKFKIEFVEFTPKHLDEGTLYISRKYSTAIHSCACGCRGEVVTPLNPDGWSLAESENGVSLHPSIGNYGFSCKSHYWIKNSTVEWAE